MLTHKRKDSYALMEEAYNFRVDWATLFHRRRATSGITSTLEYSGGLGDTVPQKESNFWHNVDVGIVGCGQWRIDACVTNPKLAKRLKSCRDKASATEFSSVGIHWVTRSILNRAATRRRACRMGVRDSQVERLLTAATAVVLSQRMTRRPLAKCSNHCSRA